MEHTELVTYLVLGLLVGGGLLATFMPSFANLFTPFVSALVAIKGSYHLANFGNTYLSSNSNDSQNQGQGPGA